MYLYCFPFQVFRIQQSLRQLTNNNNKKGISLKIYRTSIFKIYTIGTIGWLIFKVTAIIHAIYFLSTIESEIVFETELFKYDCIFIIHLRVTILWIYTL